MNEKGAWLAIISSIILLSGVTGITLYQDVFADPQEKVLICHKPGTPQEKEMLVSQKSVDGHLGHGDDLGGCNGGSEPPTEPPTVGFTKVKCNCQGGNGIAPVCTQLFCTDDNKPQRNALCTDVCAEAGLGLTLGNTCEDAVGCQLP